jgi:hypothetical protein
MCATEYIAFLTAGLVFVSEVLPFIEHRSNGILHFIYVCYNSDCMKNEAIQEEPAVDMVEVIISSDDETDDSSDY